MTNWKLGLVLLIGIGVTPVAWAEESRDLVAMPEMMQTHMLANMRDHLLAVQEITGALAADDVSRAASVAEQRLGLSSLDNHGAAHMAQVIPPEMAAIGTAMHKAASQFVIVAQNAELEPGPEAQAKLFGALQDILAQCNACHQGYRIR